MFNEYACPSSLMALLALYIGKCVAPEVNLRECISCMPLQSSNKAEPSLALKPRGDVTRSPKQGYQWPNKWTCVQQNFLKKKKKKFNCTHLLPILAPDRTAILTFCMEVVPKTSRLQNFEF